MALKDWIMPILEQYVKDRNSLRLSILRTGEIPRNICELCFTMNERQFFNNLTTSQREIVEKSIKNIQEYKILSIEKSNIISIGMTKTTYYNLRSLKEIPDLPKGIGDTDNYISSSIETNDAGQKNYLYSIPITSKIYKTTFLKEFLKCFDSGLKFCNHFEGQKLKKGIEGFIGGIEKEKRIYSFEANKLNIGDRFKKQRERFLVFLCENCRKEIEKRSCPNAFRYSEYIYENLNCLWENVLFLTFLAKSNKEIKIIGEYNPKIIIEPDRIFTSFKGKIDEDILNTLNPSAMILFMDKKGIIPFIKYGIDIFCIDGDKILFYDSSKTILEDIDKIIEHVLRNLEFYYDEERGSDHDKYVKSLARIGKDLGFTIYTESPTKGSRIDCAWLDKEGLAYGAIEVEIKGGFKKDIITTWEKKPHIAIILCKAKTDSAILNLADYALLEGMPHSLVVINIETKNLFLFDKQKIVAMKQLNTSDIEKKRIEEL